MRVRVLPAGALLTGALLLYLAAGLPAAGATLLDPAGHHISAWESARIKSKDPVGGVQALAARLLGGQADAARFEFAVLSSSHEGHDAESSRRAAAASSVFTVGRSPDGTKPLISGSSGPALTTGFYHYLKYVANASVDGVGTAQLRLPVSPLPLPLPPAGPPVTVISPFQFHWYGSFMANSYTQAFWGWARWEQHLDWCALLGFDLVMVYAGAEHVHAELYTALGLTEAELSSYFSGAAFLGWSSTRAGNLRGVAGPITPAWYHRCCNHYVIHCCRCCKMPILLLSLLLLLFL